MATNRYPGADNLLTPQNHALLIFDDAGALTNEKVREQLRQFVRGFVGFVQERPV